MRCKLFNARLYLQQLSFSVGVLKLALSHFRQIESLVQEENSCWTPREYIQEAGAFCNTSPRVHLWHSKLFMTHLLCSLNRLHKSKMIKMTLFTCVQRQILKLCTSLWPDIAPIIFSSSIYCFIEATDQIVSTLKPPNFAYITVLRKTVSD